MLDWDDLRIFLACARTGSFKDGAARLRIDPTTVARRVQRLEDSLKATLFVRSPRGLQLTAAGADLVETSQGVETAVETIERQEAFAPVGTVRLSASEGFGAHVLAPALPHLLDANPGLHVELVANAGFLSASSREVDIAVTLAPPASSRLVVERLTEYDLGLYAAPAYLARAGRPSRLADLPPHHFIGYIDDLLYAPELKYLNEIHPDLLLRSASSSIRAQLELTRACACICVLPHFIVRNSDKLERVLPDSVQLTRTFWISVHRDVLDTRRIRLVRTWLADVVRSSVGALRPT